MATLSYFLSVVIALCVGVTLLCPSSCHARYFFIFGDSLYDPGNNIFLTPSEYIPSYYPPYGTTFFNHSTGRFSDGRLIPDFIATKLNIPFIPPILDPKANFSYGASFASAGAGVFNTNPDAMYFGEQVEKFKELAENWTKALGNSNEVNARLTSAVYLICIGGDDYFSFISQYPNATIFEQQAFVDKLIGNFTTILKKIYRRGGRRFMFQNAAPIGCLPMIKQNYNLSGDACAGKPLTISKLHNAALSRVTRELQNELSGFIYSIFDYHDEVGNRINNPTAYGYKAGGVACCGSGSHRADDCGSEYGEFELCFKPSEYVFWDGGHNTDQANSQFADLMWNGGADVVAPHSMKQLFER